MNRGFVSLATAEKETEVETRAWGRGWTPSATPAGPGLHPRGVASPAPGDTAYTAPSGHQRSRPLPAPWPADAQSPLADEAASCSSSPELCKLPLPQSATASAPLWRNLDAALPLPSPEEGERGQARKAASYCLSFSSERLPPFHCPVLYVPEAFLK